MIFQAGNQTASTDVVGQDVQAQQKRAARTNLLLSASLTWTDGNIEVRIRDLSEGGALLDGQGLPQSGEGVSLQRLSLQVSGSIVWTAGSRCGVRFESPIDMDQWRTGTWISRLRPDGSVSRKTCNTSEI